MRFLQPSLSSAASRASSHVSSNPRRSSRMVPTQFFLGLPLRLFRPGVQGSTVLFGFSIRVHAGHMTQPRQSFPSDDAAQVLSCLVLSLIILFGILSLQVTCNILHSHL